MKGNSKAALAGWVCILFFVISMFGIVFGEAPGALVTLVVLVAILTAGVLLVRRSKKKARPIAEAKPQEKLTEPTTCIHCGAVDVPYSDGCCRYCNNIVLQKPNN